MDLHPGLNVFVGRNAQGKTSLLEAVGLVARGRSFRTDDAPSLIRRGAEGLVGAGRRRRGDGHGRPGGRARSRAAARSGSTGATWRPASTTAASRSSSTRRTGCGSCRGPMRDRRQFLDRSAAALWPVVPRATCASSSGCSRQRNAALEARRRDEEAWTERFVECGARLRHRRAAYAARLTGALASGLPAGRGELRGPRAGPAEASEQDARGRAGGGDRGRPAARAGGGAQPRRAAPRRGRPLLDGRDVAEGASSGQARSLLLALALASLRVYREETGRAAVALLDDLDSELDEERAGALCAEVARRGQALVTSAHPGLGGEPAAAGPDLPRVRTAGCAAPDATSERTGDMSETDAEQGRRRRHAEYGGGGHPHPRGPGGGARAPRHVHRLHRRGGAAPPRLRGRGQLGRRGARRATAARSTSPSTSTTR